MAKSTIIIEDAVDENGNAIVTISGEISGSNSGNVTQSSIMAFAVQRLFETHWLAQNVQKIVPELFEVKNVST